VARRRLIVFLALLLFGCSTKAGKPGVPSAAPSVAGVTVQVPEGAFEPGIEVTITRKDAPAGSSNFLVGPVVEIKAEGGRLPAKPVTLRFPPAPPGENLSIAYLEPDSGWWLPVETTTDPATGEQLALVDHLSWWTRFRNNVIDLTSKAPGWVHESASWVEYQGFRVFGNRGTRPRCDGVMPSWVSGELVTNRDDNAELFACGYAQGDDAVLKLVNNRGYPVTVEFSHPFSSASLSLPTSLAGVVQRLSNAGTSTRVFLVGTGSGEVRFPRPTRPVSGVVEGHVRRDGGTMLSNVVFDLLSLVGDADLPVGGGKTLGLSSIECAAAQASAVIETAEGLRTTDEGRVSGAIGGLRDCLREVVETEAARAVPNSEAAKKLAVASKFLKALAIWDVTQQAADAFVNDGLPEAALVDVSFQWRLPTPAPTLASIVRAAP
jgi:hypothetical protein